MKIVAPQHEVELKGTLKSREFTVKAGAHIMSVLSNLYSDPVDAMVREYSTNMLDAYVALARATGIQPKDWMPPILSLPTKLEPVLMFKDFGIGMSEDMVWDVYTQYGNSTKNDTNEEIGGFGLGSKTAFCYNGGSAWSIESRHGGKLHTFMAFLGKDGVPSLTHVSSVDTDEHSGVTIKIPIARKDVDAVVRAGEKYARYFPMPLTVLGATDKYEQTPGYLMKGELWGLHRNSRDANHNSHWSRETANVLNVVMGNVPYPITYQDVYQYGNAKFSHAKIAAVLSHFSFDLFVKVGEVDIVPSRDSLQYTDKTKAALNKAFDAMMKDIPNKVESEIAGCGTEYEALVKAMEMLAVLGDVFQAVDFHKMKWNGKGLNVRKGIARAKADILKFDPKATVVIYTNAYDDVFTDPAKTFGGAGNYRGSGSGDIVSRDCDSWVGRPRQYVVVNDMLKGGERIAKSYLYGQVMEKTASGRKASYGHKAGMVTILTTTKSAQEIADFFGGMPVANVLYTSKLAPTITIPTALKGAVDAVYKWGGGSWSARVNRPTGTVNYFLPLTQDNHSGRWMYADPRGHHSSMRGPIDDLANVLVAMGKSISMTSVYGVKEDEVADLDATWVNVETLARTEGLTFLRNTVDSAAMNVANHNARTSSLLHYAIPLLNAFGKHMKGDVAGALTLWDAITKASADAAAIHTVSTWVSASCRKADLEDDYKAIGKLVENKAKSIESIEKLVKELMKPYPMFALVFTTPDDTYYYRRNNNPNDLIQHKATNLVLLEYVKSVQ